MFSAFGALAALVAAMGAAAGVATYSRRFSWAALGVAIGIGLLLAAASYFWQQAILFLAIASVVFLGLGVMLQKVAPGSAIRGASAAMVLLYVFSWAAVQLGDVFFFGKHDEPVRWLNDYCRAALESIGPVSVNCTWQIALGISSIAAAACSLGRARAVLVFVGILLLALAGLHHLPNSVWLERAERLSSDPWLTIAAFAVLASLLIRLFTPTAYSYRRPKGEQRRTRNTPDRTDRDR